jgi:hypothetical protein
MPFLLNLMNRKTTFAPVFFAAYSNREKFADFRQALRGCRTGLEACTHHALAPAGISLKEPLQ